MPAALKSAGQDDRVKPENVFGHQVQIRRPPLVDAIGINRIPIAVR